LGVQGCICLQGGDVPLRDQQKMDGGSGINVLKTKDLIVFIDFLAGNSSGNNFAKDAVFVIFHGALVQKWA
jgi:hypothetical protein